MLKKRCWATWPLDEHQLSQMRTADVDPSGNHGHVLGCSGYSAPKDEEPCKQTINLVPGDEAVSETQDADEAEVQALLSKRRCASATARWNHF